ncbi:hypothetical protein ACIPK7_22750, partial [Pseudomonas sp. NPDC086581]|uniref:hypothetical protein n=1 Tax=Pseudomonas sp. NPDC086581 TaxID=3364432 RepID=UPI003821DFBA
TGSGRINSTTGYRLRWPKKNSTHCPGWVDHYSRAAQPNGSIGKIQPRQAKPGNAAITPPPLGSTYDAAMITGE